MKKILGLLAFLVAAALPAQSTTTFHLFDAGLAVGVSQSPAVGDLIYVTDTAGHMHRLAIGASGKCLEVSGGLPSWQTCGGGGGSSPLTTKGDLWGFDSADNRVPVGANGTFLGADSTAGVGVSWRLLLAADIPAIPESGVTGLVSDLAAKLDLAGGTMSGAIAMGSHKITGLTNGSSAQDAAAFGQIPVPIVTTKGDLLTYSTVPIRLAVGSDTYVLTADSAQATGIKWAASSGGFTSPLTTKGDIHVFTSTDARLAVGTNGFSLFADSTQTPGMLWRAIAEGDVTSLSTDLTARPTGSGTTGHFPYWSGSAALSDSALLYDATHSNAGIGGTDVNTRFTLKDAINGSQLLLWGDSAGINNGPKAIFQSGIPSVAQEFSIGMGFGAAAGNFVLKDDTAGVNRAEVNSSGLWLFNANASFGTGRDPATVKGGVFTNPFEVGTITAASRGTLIITGSKTGADAAVSELTFANDAIGGSDRRMGVLRFNRSGADTSSQFQIFVDNAGTLTNALQIEHDGKVGLGNITPVAGLDVSGTVALRSQALTLSNGANQNVTLPTGASSLIVTAPTAAFSIGGLAGAVDGQQVEIANYTAYTMTLNFEDSGSTAANRILVGTSTNVTIPSYGVASVRYFSGASRWFYTSGATSTTIIGGVGISTSKGADASAPANATATTGNLYLDTDGLRVRRDNGTTYDSWGPVYPLSDALPTFAWRNQATRTISTAYGGEEMTVPATVGQSVAGREITVPSTPYSIAGAWVTSLPSAASRYYGLYITDGTKLEVFGLPSGGSITTGGSLVVDDWTNVTTYGANRYTVGMNIFMEYGNMGTGNLLFLRIADDGTTMYFEYSWDGIHYQTWQSYPHHTYLTATKIGWFGYNQNAGGAGITTAYMRLIHWAQTATAP